MNLYDGRRGPFWVLKKKNIFEVQGFSSHLKIDMGVNPKIGGFVKPPKMDGV